MSFQHKNIRIDGERLYLRSLTEKDATEAYCSWLNDPETNRYLETRQTTIKELEDYIREKNNSGNAVFLGIISKDGERHIGNIKLEPIDLKTKKATLGLLIGNKEYWGKGFGTEATKLLVEWGFNNLGLKEINLGVISGNKAAIKVYEKAGFQIARVEKINRGDGTQQERIIMVIKNKR